MRFFNLQPLLFASLIAFTFLISSRAPATKDLKTQKPAPTVLVEKLRKSELAQVLAYPARVESSVSATVLADADGIVTKLKPLGSLLERGTSIMHIEQTDPIYQYAPFKVSSPVRGALSSLDVSEGTRVTRGQKIATVVDPTKIQLAVEVPSSDLTLLKSNMIGEFKMTNGEPLKVQVLGLSPVVNSQTGTAEAVLGLKFEKDRNSLRVGQVGRVEFKADSTNGILVTESAVIYRGANPFVRVVESGIAKYKSVSLGRRMGAQFEILKGLNENDLIITRASGFIAENESVQVQNQDASGAKDEKKN